MPIVSYGGLSPRVGSEVWLAPTAYLSGNVVLGERSSFFFGAVARGDILPIEVGAETNVQEHALLHTSHGLTPCLVGSQVTVGHRAILHGCTVGDRCIVGMGAIVLDGAEIGADCIIGAQSLVTLQTKIPAGHLAFGTPAKVVRPLTNEEIAALRSSARSYVESARQYRALFGAGLEEIAPPNGSLTK